MAKKSKLPSRLLALDWDRTQLRIVAAQAAGDGIRLVLADSLSLIEDTADGTGESNEPTALVSRGVDQALAQWVADNGYSGSEVVVTVPRSDVELRLLDVPPAPPDELPDIVRFQAQQTFASLEDSWPLDFLPIPSDDGTIEEVVAAAIPDKQLRAIANVCERASLKLRGLVLRPTATGSLLRRAGAIPADRYVMLVETAVTTADLTVLSNSTILLTRTARLPHHAAGESAAIAAEIRRTVLAAQPQLGTDAIDRVILCSDHSDDLQQHLRQNISLPIDVFDPLKSCRLAPSVKVPSQSENFAPVLGLLTDELHGAAHGIDFIRPRRPAPPPDRQSLYMTVAGIAAAAVLLLALGIWWRLGAIDGKIKELRAASLALDKSVATAQSQASDLADLEDWNDGTVNWLVELRRLSQKIPQADRLRVSQIQCDMRAQMGGGSLTIKGYVDDSSTVAELESSLTDENHEVAGIDRSQTGDFLKYPWFFTERMTVSATKMLTESDGEGPSEAEGDSSSADNDTLHDPPSEAASEDV